MHSPELDAFSPAERSALRLDGHVVRVRDVELCVDTPYDSVRRLDAVLPRDRLDAVAIQATALWVWGIIDESPHPHTVSAVDFGRFCGLDCDYRAREIQIAPGDLVVMGNRLITTPTRCALDISRYEEDEERAMWLLSATTQHPRFNATQALRVLASKPHLPFSGRARNRLRRCL